MALYKRILIAVDFSDHSHKAVQTGGELAKQFGARVDLVHAFELPLPLLTPYEVALPADFIGEAREAASRELAKVKAELVAMGVQVESHLRDGAPDVAIDELAQKLGTDLIVIGTRGHTGLKHVLLGSVAERTLRHAPCPVLTVK
jgi:nucleotide-binding universal stress UspA family protein